VKTTIEYICNSADHVFSETFIMQKMSDYLVDLTVLTELRFYVPLDTAQLIPLKPLHNGTI